MIFVTGDCHADWSRFSHKAFPEQDNLARDDFVIVLGDFGIWHDTSEERYWLKWMSAKNFTILFVDGNHENFDRLYSDEFEVVDFHGGKAHKIRDNIYHLMRGYVFDLCDKKIFTMGGAKSHDISDGILDVADFAYEEQIEYDFKAGRITVFDRTAANRFNKKYKELVAGNKMFRTNHISWWKQELPSESEMAFGKESLAKYGNEVDFILTHCLPKSIAACFGYTDNDTLSEYFDDLLESGLKFKKWYCGHYHKETSLGDFIIKFRNIEQIA